MKRVGERSRHGATSPRSLRALVCLAASLACSTPAGDEPGSPLARRVAELAGGSVDASHTGVLALLAVTSERIELCTGTLLAPNLLLTARHCLAETSSDSLRCGSSPAFFRMPYDIGSLWVNHAGALRAPLVSYGLLTLSGGSDEFISVAEVVVPDVDVVCGGDIAVMILDGQLDAETAEPIAPRLDSPVTTGEPYTAVGFGATPDTGTEGVRRYRAGLETSCGGEDCRDRTDLAANEFGGGDGVCSGDSGGPALAADGRIIGVASRSSDCTRSVYSAVSSWSDFIRPIARRALLLGDYPEPEWLAAPPTLRPTPTIIERPTPVDGMGDARRDRINEALDEPAAADERAPDPAASAAVDGGAGCGLSPTPRERNDVRCLLGAACAALLAARRRRMQG